jgi:hypothetical protein
VPAITFAQIFMIYIKRAFYFSLLPPNPFVMMLLFYYLLFSFMVVSINAVKYTHINDFMKTQPARNREDVHYGPISNDSHEYLNQKYKNKNKDLLIHKNRLSQIHSEIELGHTGRKEFIPLMDQRNQHEERAHNALIVGTLIRKTQSHQGDPLIKYAKEQREKSQQVQRQMNAIKNNGHIDPEAERKDRLKLRAANSRENYKRKREGSSEDHQRQIKQRRDAQRNRNNSLTPEQIEERRERNREYARRYREARRIRKALS